MTEINSKRVVTLDEFPKINESYGYDDVMTIAYRIPRVDFDNTTNHFRVECGFNSTAIPVSFIKRHWPKGRYSYGRGDVDEIPKPNITDSLQTIVLHFFMQLYPSNQQSEVSTPF